MLCLPNVCRSSLPLLPVNTLWRNIKVSAAHRNEHEAKGKIKILQKKRRVLMGMRKQLLQKHIKIEKKIATTEKNIQKWQRELTAWRERNLNTGKPTE